MVYMYRVRGPYATAVAKMVLEAGHELVDLSDQLAQRLSLPPRREEAPHATIKVSEEDPSTIVVIGLRKAVEDILNVLVSRIPYISYEFNIYGPYTTIVARVRSHKNGQCIAEYKDMIIVIQGYSKCVEGETATVHIVKPATLYNKIAIAYPGISILKDTLVLLGDGMGKVMFSEHLRDPNRKATLLTIASTITRLGYSIRWRSSAKSTTLEKIAKDLEEALSEIEKVRRRSFNVGDVVTEGEAIAFINLSRQSKEYLDDVRNITTPTALGHHFLRSCTKLTEFVDILDIMSKYIDRAHLYKALMYAIADNSVGKQFKILHRKPTGEKIEIGPIEVVDTINDEDLGKIVVGRRVIKSEGIYDGLDVPRERGDIALTFIPIDGWFIVHRYAKASGEEKGIYININTPPEICLDDRTISYLDLYIDLVYLNGKVEVIDREELNKVVENGILSIDFVDRTNKTLDFVTRNIDYIVNLARSAISAQGSNKK